MNSKPTPAGAAAAATSQKLAPAPHYHSVWARCMVRLLLLGGSLGTALGLLGLGNRAHFSLNNSIDPAQRSWLLMYTLGGGVLAALLGAGYLLLGKSPRVGGAKLAVATRLMAPLGLVGGLPLVFDHQLFLTEKLLGAVVLTGFGLGAEAAFRISLTTWGDDAIAHWQRSLATLAPAWQKRLPPLLVGLAALAVGLFFANHAIALHRSLRTLAFDLGIFDNLLWNLSRGHWFKSTPELGPGGCHLEIHASFIACLLVPFYLLWQKAETLLVMQSALMVAAAIPLYLLGVRKLRSRWFAAAIACVYLLQPAFHGAAFYDFHFLTIAPVFVFSVLYLYEVGSSKGLAVAAFLTLMVREDQGLALAAIGLYFLLEGRRPRVAATLGGLSVCYFVFAKFWLMPRYSLTHADRFTWMYKELIPTGEKGFGAILRTLLSNPLYVLSKVFVVEKLQYVLQLGAPVLFLPGRRWRVLVLFLPALVLTLLTTDYQPTVQIHFQYTSNWLPYLFYGALAVLADMQLGPSPRASRLAAVGAVCLTSLAFSYQQGAVLHQHSFVGAFKRLRLKIDPYAARDRDHLYSLIGLIPKAASVAATEAELPQLSNRENCFTLRLGYFQADYLLVRLGEVRAKGNPRNHLLRALKSGRYGMIKHIGKYMLWKRGGKKSENKRGMLLMGAGDDKPTSAAPGSAAPSSSPPSAVPHPAPTPNPGPPAGSGSPPPAASK